MDLVYTKDEELQYLIQTVVSVILDDETIPTWSIGSTTYYSKLARHICEHDEELVENVKRMTEHLRTTYRSFLEHSRMVSLVAYTKSPEHSADDDVCCVCLQSCGTTWQKVIRLRSHDGDPKKCGHRLHKTCALHLRPNQEGNVQCPLCRESLGPFLRSWVDDEAKTPRF